jgi:hypothetical protein
MPVDQELTSHPPTTRALRTIKGARLELARLYNQVKSRQLDPSIAGKCAHILSILIGSAREHVFESRLDAIEAQLKAQKPNGRASGEAHTWRP